MLAKFAVFATAAMAVGAAAAPYPPANGGWSNVPYSEPAGISSRSVGSTSDITSAVTSDINTVTSAITTRSPDTTSDLTSDITSAITSGINSVTSAISSASNTVTSALSSLPNGISSSPGSNSSNTAGGAQCGQSQVLSCCSNNTDSSATGGLLPFIGANCIAVPVGVVPVGTFCGNQQVSCCSSNQNGLINVDLGCIPIAA